jgi:multidrug efflux pump subunit AcrA (membrane-fusion protein)
MMRRFIAPALIVLASLVGGVALVATSPALEPTSPEPVATAVRVITVRPESVRLTVHSQGTVSPNTESELVSEVAGRVVWKSQR